MLSLNVARGKVSEDLFKNHKEMVMVHEAKDKVWEVYEKAKETASQKVHEAKECVEDA